MTSSPSLAARGDTSPKRISILGSTGTIGQNTIDLLNQNPEKYDVVALTARNNVDGLITQAKQLKPSVVSIENEEHYQKLKDELSGDSITILSGKEGVLEAASEASDWVMSGIVGSAALAPTLAAIKQGANIALANKECLVCAGSLVLEEAKKHNAILLPVDSEHNAIFQAFDFEQPERIAHITLTASGGPFLNTPAEALAEVTPAQAAKHPNWEMGQKISIDSATMMNKSLEVIEAFHLFPVTAEQIKVLVHPESIVHGIVSYTDGSMLAGLSSTDMRVPIAHTLHWPKRDNSHITPIDLADIGSLTFKTPDEARFPALRLAKEILRQGGNAGTVFNAANEIAVEGFIARKIRFTDIVPVVEETLTQCDASNEATSLEEIEALDSDARNTAQSIINNMKS
jgi:1-deoxy-D-xylulose-5-phosphate reductoisomerase